MSADDFALIYIGLCVGVCIGIWATRPKTSPIDSLISDVFKRSAEMSKRAQEWEDRAAEDRAIFIDEIADAVTHRVERRG